MKTLSRSQQRRRDDIVEAALKIFERDGFDSAKMADIAEEAGVAKGTLYLYFDTKADLLEGVIATSLLPTLQLMGDAAEAHAGSARDLLTQQIRLSAGRVASPEMKVLMRLMMSGEPAMSGIIRYYFDNVVKEAIEQYRATLKLGVSTGEFCERAAEVDPFVLVGGQVYMMIWNVLFSDIEQLDIEKLTVDYIDNTLLGLMKRE